MCLYFMDLGWPVPALRGVSSVSGNPVAKACPPEEAECEAEAVSLQAWYYFSARTVSGGERSLAQAQGEGGRAVLFAIVPSAAGSVTCRHLAAPSRVLVWLPALLWGLGDAS